MKKPLLLSMLLMAATFPSVAADITVAAASSLTDAFKVMASDFEKQHPQTKVKLTFASSGTLLQQLRNGAPIDVLATADEQTMNMAQAQALINTATRRNFAVNQLVLVVPVSSTLKINALAALNQAGVKRIAIGNPAHVPAGRYAQAVLVQNKQWQGVQAKLIKAQNVRQALDYVARGETEVGFVFATDALAEKDKIKVAMTVPTPMPIHYPIAVSKTSKYSQEAQQFLNHVNSPAGKQVLRRHGFKI